MQHILAWQFTALHNDFDQEKLDQACSEIFQGASTELTLEQFIQSMKSQPLWFLFSFTLDVK